MDRPTSIITITRLKMHVAAAYTRRLTNHRPAKCAQYVTPYYPEMAASSKSQVFKGLAQIRDGEHRHSLSANDTGKPASLPKTGMKTHVHVQRTLTGSEHRSKGQGQCLGWVVSGRASCLVFCCQGGPTHLTHSLVQGPFVSLPIRLSLQCQDWRTALGKRSDNLFSLIILADCAGFERDIIPLLASQTNAAASLPALGCFPCTLLI
jgi:hypothetical protein